MDVDNDREWLRRLIAAMEAPVHETPPDAEVWGLLLRLMMPADALAFASQSVTLPDQSF
jgi:hypothetical protein